jgi:hypothetical protein
MTTKFVCSVGCPNIVEDAPGDCPNCGSVLIEKDESEIPADWLNPTPNLVPVTPVVPPVPAAIIPELPTILAVNVSDGSQSKDFLPGTYKIGRAGGNDFSVPDEWVSRSHMELIVTETSITLSVSPAASNRAISVNGVKTDDPTDPIELPIGDSTVEIGSSTILTISTTTA